MNGWAKRRSVRERSGSARKTLDELTQVFAAYPELTEVVLFGSRATGAATARSDIDLATRGIADDQRLGRLALDLDDLPIPQQCDLQAWEKILRSATAPYRNGRNHDLSKSASLCMSIG